MSDFVDSLRSDLLGRRLRLVVALLVIALIAAIVYAVLAGSGSSAPTALSPTVPPAVGVRLTPVGTEASQAIAETTSGAGQSSGAARNPFKPLSEPKAKTASTSPSPSGSPASGSQPGTSTGSETSSKPESSSGAAPSKPKSQKPKTVYRVSVQFGAAAPGTPPEAAQLTPFEDLARQQPLPSAQQALIVFRGVIAGGKSATFTLVGEAILRGAAVCRPSAAQCQAIDLKAGQTEELEYAPPGVAPTNYLLHIVSIDSKKATASAARRIIARESKAGAKLLRSTDLQALPGLRYSAAKGVLVFAGSRAHDARASIATVAVLGSAPQGPSASK